MSDAPRRKIEAALASARTTVQLLEAELEQIEQIEIAGPDAEQLIGADQALAEYGFGHAALLAAADRGEITLSRGPRDKILVTRGEIRRCFATRKPRRQKAKAAPVTDMAAWDRAAEKSLRASLKGLQGGKR